MQVRNTAQRKIILDIMKDNYSHPTAEEIYEAARSIDEHISRGTVYRNLGFLSEKGEILKIRVPNGSDHYDSSLHEHHHFCCDECSSLFDVPESVKVKASKISDLMSKEGFTLNSHNLIFTGLCPECGNKKSKETNMDLKEFKNGKIAATYDASSETIFQHFGRTQNFKIYTIEDGKVSKSEVIDNGGFGHHDLATYLKDCGIEILILGNRGQGAIDALNNAGIAQLAGITGSPDEAVKLFLEGNLKDNPDAKCNHHGEHHHHEETSGGMIFKPIK